MSAKLIDLLWGKNSCVSSIFKTNKSAETKIRWTERLDGGESWGSVVMAAGRLYVTSRKGVTTVFRPDPEKLEVLAMNDLGEPSNATPAISDGQIFLRTDGHLYCIAEN